MKGKFITLEGFEGSGKSTQAGLLFDYLKSKRLPVIYIREPGGVKISEEIRKILLDVENKKMTKIAETLLYMAARAQLVEEIVMPALNQGKIVLCDRFLDSTVVYQGYGNGVDLKFIKTLGKVATQNIKPDITFLFDIDVKEGLSRRGKEKDRIERKSLDFHRRVRSGYLEIAKFEPGRIKMISSRGSKEEIQGTLQKHIEKFLHL